MIPIFVHPEGPRYARALIFVPGLWTPPAMLRPLASFLAHRGWAGTIVDARGTGGVDERAADLAEIARGLETPPVVVGHDAGGLIALAAGRLTTLGGVAWLAPIGPRPRELTRLLGTWRVAAAVLRGRDLPVPRGAAAMALFGEATQHALLETESIRLVRDVLRGGPPASPSPILPVALVRASGDVFAGRAAVPGAEALVVEAAGRCLLGASAWRPTADVVHRWLIRRLGAANLELYEEAMADRDAIDPE